MERGPMYNFLRKDAPTDAARDAERRKRPASVAFPPDARADVHDPAAAACATAR